MPATYFQPTLNSQQYTEPLLTYNGAMASVGYQEHSGSEPDNRIVFTSNRDKKKFPKQQVMVVIRHGEREDEKLEKALFNPSLTQQGTLNIEEKLKPQLLSKLQELYDINEENLKNEFVVISSPFKRCKETAAALINAGVGSAHGVQVDDSLGPLIDDRVCEVFGPIRIKNAVVSDFGGVNKLHGELTNDSFTYFGQWCKEKGSKNFSMRGKNGLPVYGEDIEDALDRYRNSMREIAVEMASVPSAPKHVIIVSHGDMLDALLRGLQPDRTVYEVEYLAFAILERRLTGGKIYNPIFTDRDFRIVAEHGIGTIGEPIPNTTDWDAPVRDFRAAEPNIEVESYVGSGGSVSPAHTVLSSAHNNDGTPAYSSPSVPTSQQRVNSNSQRPPVPSAGDTAIVQIYHSPDNEHHQGGHPAPIESYGSCDENDPLCDGSYERRTSNGSMGTVAVVCLAYLCVAGMHIGGFCIAASVKSGVAKSEAYAVGTAGSIVILLLASRHCIPQFARLTNAVEISIVSLLCPPKVDALRSPIDIVESQTQQVHQQRNRRTRSYASRALMAARLGTRMFMFAVIVAAFDIGAAYITSNKTGTGTSYLWRSINANAGPWVLYGAALILWTVTEGLLAPYLHVRHLKSDRRRVEPSVHA